MGAGLSNTIESGNIFIGYSSNGVAGISNATAIGVGATVTHSDSLVLGNSVVNVGIGTPAPLARLDVRGDVFVGLTAPADNTTTAGNNIYVADDGGGDARNSYRIDSYNNNFYFVARSGKNSTAGAGIVFRTAPAPAPNANGAELDRMAIDPNGNVGIGIGTTSPSARLEVAAGGSSGLSAYFHGGLLTDGSITTNGGVFVIGDIHAQGDVCAHNVPCQSDARLKQAITNLHYGLREVLRLRPVRWQ